MDNADYSEDTAENKECHVCGKPNSHLRYNGLACNACRVFFYRAIQNNLKWPCLKDNNCVVSFLTERNNCFACRLRKCYEAHMEEKNVGKKSKMRREIVPTMARVRMIRLFTNIYCCSQLNNGSKAMAHLQNYKSIISYVHSLAGFDKQIVCQGGPSPSSTRPDLSLFLNELLISPGACIDRNTATNDLISGNPMNPNVPYKLMSSLTRMLVASAELMCLVEEFQSLSQDDKMRLIQHNSWGLNSLLLRYEKYVKRMGDGFYLQYISRYKATENLTENWKQTETYKVALSSNRHEELFYEIQPSSEEAMLLRLIVLFHPFPDQGYNYVIKARMRLLLVLEEFIAENMSQLSRKEVLARICSFLEVERHVMEGGQSARAFYCRMRLQNGGTLEQLEHDLFIRVF